MRSGKRNSMVNLQIKEIEDGSGGGVGVEKQMKDFDDALKETIQDALDDYCEVLLKKLYEVTPKDTGETAASWEVIPVAMWDFFISNSNEPIATFLSEGTVDHWVAPVTAKALHWTVGGVSYFSKGHMVRGIQAMHLEQLAMDWTQPALEQLMDEAESLAFDKAFKT